MKMAGVPGIAQTLDDEDFGFHHLLGRPGIIGNHVWLTEIGDGWMYSARAEDGDSILIFFLEVFR